MRTHQTHQIKNLGTNFVNVIKLLTKKTALMMKIKFFAKLVSRNKALYNASSAEKELNTNLLKLKTFLLTHKK